MASLDKTPVNPQGARVVDGRERHWQGVAMVMASSVAYSTAGFFTRLVAADTWTVLFWRAVFGGLAIGSYVIWQHRRQTVTAFLTMGRAGIAVALC